jgi:hypothetical protein
MIAASARYTQNITKFIHMTGAANIGWTEAGCIAGNDPYPGRDACRSDMERKRHRIRMDRFYKPIWVEDAEEMQAQLDLTRQRVMLERAEEFEIERMLTAGRIAEASHKTRELLQVFDLEWDR